MGKDFLQDELSELLNNPRNLRDFNKKQTEGYKTTILRYKSILHNTSEDNINSFYEKVFNEEKLQKQLGGWTDFKFGKIEALKDISLVLKNI